MLRAPWARQGLPQGLPGGSGEVPRGFRVGQGRSRRGPLGSFGVPGEGVRLFWGCLGPTLGALWGSWIALGSPLRRYGRETTTPVERKACTGIVCFGGMSGLGELGERSVEPCGAAMSAQSSPVERTERAAERSAERRWDRARSRALRRAHVEPKLLIEVFPLQSLLQNRMFNIYIYIWPCYHTRGVGPTHPQQRTLNS